MKNKITKDTVPEGFTIKLALADAVPVLFFGGSMIAVSVLFKSRLFLLGAFLCLIAGAAKVLWKIIVVLKKKNVWTLFMQMRILMPIGMIIMITAAVINKSAVNFSALFASAVSFPSAVFFCAGIIGMIMMTVFAFRLDSSDAESNRIEQLTNGIAQACFFFGLLFMAV